MLATFEEELRLLVLKAQSRVLAQLQRTLSITDGMIDQTPGNMRLMRNLNNLFIRELQRGGLDALLETFVGEFKGSLPYLTEILKDLSSQMQRPLELGKLGKQDFAVLSSFQANTVSGLETVMEAAAGQAMQRGLFVVGGLKFGDLVQSLTTKFEASIGNARSLADTAMSTFYRTATDRVFQTIQSEQEEELKYRYSGPDDKLTRPFCRHLVEGDGSYTRAQIDRMNNHQFPVGSVFFTGGGWNCRHSWLMDVRALESSLTSAAA